MAKSFARAFVVLALFALDLGACGSSPPHTVAASLASVRGSSAASVSVGAGQVELTIDTTTDGDACPALHATATVNGRPMNLASAGGYSSGTPAGGCSGKDTYRAAGCEPTVFVADTAAEQTLTIEVTDESDTFNVVANGFYLETSASLLTSPALVPGETTRIALTPAPPVGGFDVSLWPHNQFIVPASDVQMSGNTLSFVVPPAQLYNAQTDDDASTDGGDVNITCMMQHHAPCPEMLEIGSVQSVPDSIATCDGPSVCSAAGTSGMADISVDVTYAP
jgi:hypothetical protein